MYRIDGHPLYKSARDANGVARHIGSDVFAHSYPFSPGEVANVAGGLLIGQSVTFDRIDGHGKVAVTRIGS